MVNAYTAPYTIISEANITVAFIHCDLDSRFRRIEALCMRIRTSQLASQATGAFFRGNLYAMLCHRQIPSFLKFRDRSFDSWSDNRDQSFFSYQKAVTDLVFASYRARLFRAFRIAQLALPQNNQKILDKTAQNQPGMNSPS